MALTVPHIEELLNPGAEALGLEIVSVEMGGGDRAIVRVFIDNSDGVSVDDCASASRQFSAILDVEDPIANRYTLEVSSPGLDRPLSKPKHFVAVIGSEIKIKTASLMSGRRRFKGKLLSASESEVSIEVDGETIDIPYADMDRARLVPVYDFGADSATA